MEDQVITTTEPTVVEADTSSVVSEQIATTEPTVVESANTSTENTAGLSQVVESPTVVDQATPMDSNTTYNSIPKEETMLQKTLKEAVAIERELNLETNNTTYMDKFLNEEYDYDKNEAGTYWVAGAINDVETQMGFLNTLINEEMYDEMDLQKHFYDTNLATARAYAAQKNREVAYGFYQAAQEKALAEAELTGWYMPAEGAYMLGQYNIAESTLKNKDATSQEISKANRVINTVEKWFGANQISSRGIKCLNMMNYEESVRHNTIMGELKMEGLKIQAAGAAASAAAANLQFRDLKFKIEEMEIQYGQDFSTDMGLDSDNIIGHKKSDYPGLGALQGFNSLKDALSVPKNYKAIMANRGVEGIRMIFGDDYAKFADQYESTLAIERAKVFTENESWNGKYFTEEAGVTEKAGVTYKDKAIHTMLKGNNEVLVGYYDKNGVFVAITDEETVLGNGKTVSDLLDKRYGENNTFKLTDNTSINIDGDLFSIGKGSTQKEATSFTTTKELGGKRIFYNNNYFRNKLSEKGQQGLKDIESEKGYTDADGNHYAGLSQVRGKYSTEGRDNFVVYKDPNNDKYYRVIPTTGGNDFKLKEVSESSLKEIPTVKNNIKKGDLILIDDFAPKDSASSRIMKSSIELGEDKDGISYYQIDHSNNKTEYIAARASKDRTSFEIIKTNLTSEEIETKLNKAVTKTSDKPIKGDQTKSSEGGGTDSFGGGGSGGGSRGGLSEYKEVYNPPTYEKYLVDNVNSEKAHELAKRNIKEDELKKEQEEYYTSILGQGGEHRKKGR